MKSLAHPEWPYTGTPWEWRGWRFEGVAPVSFSHWGVFYIDAGDAYRTGKAIEAAKSRQTHHING